jgi:hypothetical protein
MSVWKNACYRDDAFNALAQWVPRDALESEFFLSLCDYDVEDPGDFPLPGGIRRGNLRSQIEKDPSILSALHDKVPRPDIDSPALVELTARLGPARFGVHGVYKFVAENWSAIFKPGTLSRGDRSFYQQVYSFGGAASYRTGREVSDRSVSSATALEKHLVGPTDAIRTLIRIGTFSAGARYKARIRAARQLGDPYPEVDPTDSGFLRRYTIFWWKGTLILQDPRTDRCYVFTRSDIERIERFVLGLAWCSVYFAEYSAADPGLNARLTVAYDSFREIIRSSILSVRKTDANKLCRAFDVLVWYYIAGETQDVNDTAYKQQKRKIRDESLGDLVPIEQVMRLVKKFRMKEALEILQVYKAFPQPDFDYFGAANRQLTLYSKPKTFGIERETTNTGFHADFWRYFKFVLIKAFAQKHGVCPGYVKPQAGKDGWRRSYPHISADKIPPNDTDDIVMTGCFSYIPHAQDILDMVKDKAICPESMQDNTTYRDIQKLPIEDKNQLMDVLGREVPINMVDLIGGAVPVFDDVRAEDKPEAKKPNGRWFFEAGTHRRLIQSEYESSVAEYAKATTGCMAGKGTRDKIAAMNYLTELPRIGTEAFTRPYMISFDLDKFSPSLSYETHDQMDDILADAFGMPHIAGSSKVFTEGKIHYVKRKVHHVFNKMGRDFEGFAGRKNTIYHCAVMGYCVRRLRNMKLIPQGGRFVSLIDDGLLRVEVPVAKFDETVVKITQVIEETYNMCNLYISWDKTFVSSHFAVFLNEFFYDGTPVTPGIRSFLKITNRSDALCPSMVDDLGMLESTTRGSITAGTTPSLSYIAYAWGVLDTFRKWGKSYFKANTRTAIAAFSPIALGGFGCVGMAALSGSVGANPIVEGIGNLRAIAVRYRTTATMINELVNQPMAPVAAIEKIRAPLAVRRDGRTLKATRGRAVIERRLMNMIDTPVVRALVGNVGVRSADSIVDAIPSFGRTSVEFLDSVWRSSIEATVSNIAAKFLRARTAYKLVKRGAFYRAFAANMTEARALVGEWGRA